MNRRERVLAAIHHEQTDFVPYNFHATGAVYQELKEHYRLADNNAVVDFIGNHLVKIGSDFNVNNPNQLGTGGSGVVHVYSDSGTHYLEIGSEGNWAVKVVTAP